MQKLVAEHRISRLVLAGATPYGTVNNLDLFFVAETDAGPMMIRVSVYFSKTSGPLLFAIDLFEGFASCREALSEIKHLADQRVYSVDLKQDQEAQPGNTPNAG